MSVPVLYSAKFRALLLPVGMGLKNPPLISLNLILWIINFLLNETKEVKND
jgi:hypothetical protein